jgi:thiol-disulfide isomerase/thioredoxin
MLSLSMAGTSPADESTSEVVTLGDSAICHVCRVHEGEVEEEDVKAIAEHGGETYGFCSQSCREKFLEAPESYVPPVLPRPAPGFTVHDLEGAEVDFEAYRGKTVLLDFWATWCPPCIKDLPELTRLHERYGEAGFVVLSVSIDEDDAVRKVRRTVKRRKARHPVFLDTADPPAWGAYGVRVVPMQFLIDGEGQIVQQWSGKIDLGEVEAEIVRLVGVSSP